MTVRDIITDGLRELQYIGAAETPSAEDMDMGLLRFNRMMDMWAAKEILAFDVDLRTFALQANHSPHTIGPSGDFNMVARPVMIPSASVILGAGSTAVDSPLEIRDGDWWSANPVKAQTGALPSNLYYAPSWPNGNCYFWPISTQVYTVRLEMWAVIMGSASVAATAFSLPQGYWNAVVLNLALQMASACGAAAQVTPLLINNAREALQTIMGNNSQAPRIDTNSGMPNSGGGRPDFNFLTGLRD